MDFALQPEGWKTLPRRAEKRTWAETDLGRGGACTGTTHALFSKLRTRHVAKLAPTAHNASRAVVTLHASPCVWVGHLIVVTNIPSTQQNYFGHRSAQRDVHEKKCTTTNGILASTCFRSVIQTNVTVTSCLMVAAKLDSALHRTGEASQLCAFTAPWRQITRYRMMGWQVASHAHYIRRLIDRAAYGNISICIYIMVCM